MPKVHRVGDFDTGGDMATIGSEDVFANGGPTLGGSLSEVFNLPDIVGVDDETARMILSDRADELARGGDPDTNEPFEQFDPASGKGVNPVDGSTGLQGAPGSPAGGISGGFGQDNLPTGGVAGGFASSGNDDETGTIPFDNSTLISDWLLPEPQVNMAVQTSVFKQAEKLAKAFGKPLRINSGYRTPEYNRKVGGSKKSQHVEKKALDIRWPVGDFNSRIEFIQLCIDNGFSGIGVYNSFIHVDIGSKRCWGPNGGRASVYQQYLPVLKKNGYNAG